MSTNRSDVEFISGQSKLEFDSAAHVYTYQGKKLESVNSILKKYSIPFDEDGSIIARKASENGITVEEQRKIWDEAGRISRERGTAFHNDIEQYIKTKKIPNTNNKDLIKQFVDLKLQGLLFPEVRLHNLSYSIAGTTDLIQLNRNGSINCLDFKTNQAKKMSRFSWRKKMLYPLNHISDSVLDKFELQLSTYGFMLELAGWWIKELKVIHIDYNKGQIKELPMQYRIDDVKIMLEHYKENYINV